MIAEGDELVIGLRIPAVNVVGFEHQPSTDEQRQAVEDALGVFRQGEKLFSPSTAARCFVDKVEVALAGVEHDGDDEREHHAEHAKMSSTVESRKVNTKRRCAPSFTASTTSAVRLRRSSSA